MNRPLLTISVLSFAVILSACSGQQSDGNEGSTTNSEFESQVEEYIQKFPYQDTYNYAMNYTGGDAANFNIWILGVEPMLVKAGQDKVVRMNNDTYYKMAFLVLENGPVVLSASSPSDDRFNSFQLMDDRNANYRNVVNPSGEYTLYYGDKPENIQGEAIQVPSLLSVVIVRVEVKDKNDAADVSDAKAVFAGISVTGPVIEMVPELDLLVSFDENVATEAVRRLDETFASVPFTDTIVGPGQTPGNDVPYLNHAAGTKGGWGGPDPKHSAYGVIFTDATGETLDGAKGIYTLTTEEPPVDAFWSLTVYDSERGGYFHPNKDDRYHINNTSAVKDADGTVTFVFKQECSDEDQNCLAVPSGPFDLVARYYLPHEEIINGSWVLPGAILQN